MDIAEQVTQLKTDFDEVYEARNKAFWESFNKTYTSATTYKQKTGFASAFFGWNDDMFYPTVKLYPEVATNMFSFFNQNRPPVNLKERLIVSGGELDFSRCTNANSMFSTASISVLPIIDFSMCTVLNNAFNNCNVESIEKVVLKNDGSQTFPNTFNGCTSLTDIIIEGKIGTNITFGDCSSLSSESVQSIIDALLTITDGVARTITFHQAVRNKLSTTQVDTIKNVKGWSLLPAEAAN